MPDSKNYLDIAASGELVKKSIEEICHVISQNPEENNGKYLQLIYDSENEYTNELDRVFFVLSSVEQEEVNIPEIEGELGQLIINNGEKWISPSEIFCSSNDTESRIGPDLAKSNNKLVLSNNPLFKTDDDGNSIESNTYKLILSDTAKAYLQDSSMLYLAGTSQTRVEGSSTISLRDRAVVTASGSSSISSSGSSKTTLKDYAEFATAGQSKTKFIDNANVSFGGNNLTSLDGSTRFTMHDSSAMDLTRDAQIFAHGPVQLHIDDGKYYSRITVYSRLYYSDIGGRPSPDLTAEEIRTNAATSFSFSSSGYSSIEELLEAGYVLEENNSFSKYSTYYYLFDTFVSVDMKSNYSGYNSTESYLNGAAIRMHDKALLSMGSGASIIAHDTPAIYFEDNARTYIRGDSFTEINGTTHTYIRDEVNINMTNAATLTMHNEGGYDPCLCMNGGTILFNAGDKSKVPYDPYLIAEPNQITYIGQAATGVSKTSYYNYPKSPAFFTPKMIKFEGSFTFTDTNATTSVRRFDDFTDSNKTALISALRAAGYGDYNTIVKGSSSVTSKKLDTGYSYTVSNFYYGQGGTDVFGDLNDLVPENNNPRFRIANESMIIVDTYSDSGANYIRIGAADKLLQIIKMGNIFEQMTGNAHSEMHDNSCFIMRGKTTTVPWAEGMRPSTYTKTHLDKTWRRPIETEDSPLLSLYDSSQFIMRGRWNYSKDFSIYSNTFTFIDTEISEAPTSIASMAEATKEKFFNTLNESSFSGYGYSRYNNLRDAYDVETGELLTTIITTENADGGFSISVSNFEYNDVPEGWSESLKKIEGQSLLEVVEDAEVRISGNSILKMNDFNIEATSEGISFGDGTEKVTFSIEELKKLKTFLSNSEIEE